MIKRGIIKIGIDLIRNSARGIMLISTVLLAFFLCWFIFHFLARLMEYCENTIFSQSWGGY